MATPWDLASLFYQSNMNAANQMRGDAQQTLLSLFAEEAARQRPYVTMPARLAEAQFDRQNAEPFAERAAQRRYRYSKAGQEEETTGGSGVQTLEDGTEILTVGKTQYITTPDGKVVTRQLE